VGAELFHADRRTDMTKLTARFHNFAKAPKKTNTTTYITLHTVFLKILTNSTAYSYKLTAHRKLYAYLTSAKR